MLTSSARETLAGVEVVIIDEIHALAPTKRGRPPGAVAGAAGGGHHAGRPSGSACRPRSGRWRRWPASSVAGPAPGEPRPVTIVDVGIRKPLEVEVVIPVEDMGDLGQETMELRSGPADRGAGPGPQEHLAQHLPADPGAGAGPPLHHHLLQRPPPGRAPGRPPQRAGRDGGGATSARRASWSRPTTARWPASSGWSSRTSSSGVSCGAWWPRPAWSWASTWARWTS